MRSGRKNVSPSLNNGWSRQRTVQCTPFWSWSHAIAQSASTTPRPTDEICRGLSTHSRNPHAVGTFSNWNSGRVRLVYRSMYSRVPSEERRKYPQHSKNNWKFCSWLIDWSDSWLIDWLIGLLIDWLIGLLIDWLIGLLIDWLIDWMTYWPLIFSRYFQAFERRKPLSTDPAEVPIDMPATTEDMFSLCDLILDFVRDALAKNSIDLQVAEEKLLKHSSHETGRVDGGSGEEDGVSERHSAGGASSRRNLSPQSVVGTERALCHAHSVQWTWLTAIEQLWGSRRYSRKCRSNSGSSKQSINQSINRWWIFFFVFNFWKISQWIEGLIHFCSVKNSACIGVFHVFFYTISVCWFSKETGTFHQSINQWLVCFWK